MNKTLSFLLVTGALALAACSSTKTSDSAGSCSSYVAALQASSAKCQKSSAPPGQDAAAMTRLTTLCTNILNAPGNGITTSAIDACSAELQTGSCDDDPPACEALSSVSGTLPDGTACGGDSQCQGGECKRDEATRASGCGKCAARVAIGGACGTSGAARCVSGASCVSKGSGPGTCQKRVELAEGEVCYDPSKPSSGGRAECASGLSCKMEGATLTTPAKCAKRGAAGAACSMESDCVSELSCIKGKCGALLADGAACDSSSQCATGACPQATKKCVAYVYGAAGAACNFDEKRCAKGDCAQRSGTADGKCVDPIPDGGPCSSASDSGSDPRCEEYAQCINGKCQLLDPATCK